jgi:hypothetical protein
MSAFLVSDEHISVIVAYGYENDIRLHPDADSVAGRECAGAGIGEPRCYDGANCENGANLPDYYAVQLSYADYSVETMGARLFAVNVQSVTARYPDHVDEDTDDVFTYLDELPTFSPVEIVKACDCWMYQSCEFEGHEETLAWRYVESVRSHAIHHLPGYDDAAWEINAEVIAAKRTGSPVRRIA